MKTFKFEIYRAFHSINFIISITVGLLICFLDLIVFCTQFGGGNRCLVQAWIGTDYAFVYNQMFYVLLPVLACLPYGGSYHTDMMSGYERNICIKTSRMNYVFSKCVATFMTAFVGVALPLSINLFIAGGLYPNFVPERLEWLSIGLLDRHLFAQIYSRYPALYCVIYIVVDGLFAGAIALTSISIARIVKSHFTAVVTPMVVIIVLSIILEQNANQGNWSLLAMLNPIQYKTTFWYQMLTVYILIVVGNILVIYFMSRKRDVI